MTEMIERVARVLAKADGEQDDSPTVMFDYYLELAREVIDAMREPTADMVESGAFVSLDGDDIVGRGRAKRCWQAMLNEAHPHSP